MILCVDLKLLPWRTYQIFIILNWLSYSISIGQLLNSCAYVWHPMMSGNAYISTSIHIWRRKWQPTPVLLPGEFHGQRSLEGYSPWDPILFRLPYHSPSPGVCSNSCPFSLWCHPTISSSVIPFSSFEEMRRKRAKLVTNNSTSLYSSWDLRWFEPRFSLYEVWATSSSTFFLRCGLPVTSQKTKFLPSVFFFGIQCSPYFCLS